MYGECTWKEVVSKGLTIGIFPAICFTNWIKWGLLWRTKKVTQLETNRSDEGLVLEKLKITFYPFKVVVKPGCCLLRPPPTLEHHCLFWKHTLHSRCKLKSSEYFCDFFYIIWKSKKLWLHFSPGLFYIWLARGKGKRV